MDHDAVLRTNLMLELSDSLKEWLAFDISNGSADLDYRYLSILCIGISVESVFYLIGDMWHYLYCVSSEITMALLLKDAPVYLSGCYIRILVETFVYKTLIVTEIQICFGAVVSDKNFAVLDRVHCSRINIDIRVELLACDFISSHLEKTSKRSSSNTLTESRYNTTSDKHILDCHNYILH